MLTERIFFLGKQLFSLLVQCCQVIHGVRHNSRGEGSLLNIERNEPYIICFLECISWASCPAPITKNQWQYLLNQSLWNKYGS